MGKLEFDSYLEEVSKFPTKVKNYQQRRDLYISKVNNLYLDIENWLKDYTEENKILINYIQDKIIEERFGIYDIKRMIISFGNKEVELIPVGTDIIGSLGRIDIVCNYKKSKLILVDKNYIKPRVSLSERENNSNSKINLSYDLNSDENLDLTWKIATNPPNIVLTDITVDNFLDILINVSNG